MVRLAFTALVPLHSKRAVVVLVAQQGRLAGYMVVALETAAAVKKALSALFFRARLAPSHRLVQVTYEPVY
jgi:hypothetical protein